ncbi:MAG: NfeD family protein [Candidatus Scatovivens sp.]
MWQIWLIVAGFFLILETITTGFLVFWFAVAALITMVFSFFIVNKLIQASIFVVLSVVLLFETKPLVKKLSKKESDIKTNAFSITGKNGKVLIDINPVDGHGQIKIDGEKWSAKSSDGSFIPKDSEVKVIRIDGVKAIVEPLKK